MLAFYIQGDSLQEIAERLEVPIGTIKRRLHTARKRLKVELESSVNDAEEWTLEGVEPDFDDREPECVGAGREFGGDAW